MRPGTRQIGALYGSPDGGVPFISGGRARVSTSLSHLELGTESLLTLGVSAALAAAFVVRADPGRAANVRYETLAGLKRWAWNKTATAETGGDAGSPLELRAFSDAGVLIDSPIAVVRAAAGLITIGGGGRPLTLALTNQGLRINGQASGAGAAVGTLGNAPAAGDPAFWLPINCGGTVRHFPGW